MAVGGGVLKVFSDSVHLDVESLLSVEFFGSPRSTFVGHQALMPISS